MSPVDRENLLKHERKEKCTTRTENGVVNLEEKSEFLGLTCLHDLADAKDGGEVAGKDANDDWLRGERSGATNIVGEMIGKLRQGGVLEDEIGEGSHGGEKTLGANASCL
jgi:hypothetical protein